MKVVIQRVLEASVTIDGKKVSQIQNGLLILVGIDCEDSTEDVNWLSKKTTNLRVFNDDNDVMNKSLIDIDGDAIVVSQFTLQASTKKGNRPSYLKAAKSEVSIPLYQQFVAQIEQDLGKKIQTGKFGADMRIALINDGPVTIIIDSKNRI